MLKPIRLAWLATHPIQYQAPLLRAIAQQSGIDLTALFFSDFSTREFFDYGFGRAITWDVPLLEGYKHEFLPGTGSDVDAIKTFQPIVGGLAKQLNHTNFDAVLVQGWNHYGMLEAAWLAKRAGLKVLMRCEATDHIQSSTGIKRVVREIAVRFLLSQIDFCLAIGTHNRDFYLKRGFPEERIGSMPYCVDNEWFRSREDLAEVGRLRERLGLDQGRPVILFASKLMARKLPEHLLAAYLQLLEPRPYLIFIGDGELRASLEDIVEKRQLADVRFLGFINQSELPLYYSLADIFVLPSVNETWGLVINEAMNAGCAIITSDQVGSAPDLVRDYENGFVVKAHDIDSLTRALQNCLSEERFREMGKKSLEIINSWGIEENLVGLRLVLGLPAHR